jgi:CRP/FNR family cyclic AMP-dependent transcriptional regulator
MPDLGVKHMKQCIVCLQELEIFKGLANEQMANLCQCTRKRRLSRGDFLFRQGEVTSTVFLTKAGKLKLVQISDDGRQTILDICGPGEVLGELSLYQSQKQSSSAVAIEDACVCCFSREQFEALIKQDSSFALRIISYLGQKRYENMRTLREETRQTVKEKLLGMFYRFAGEYGITRGNGVLIDLRITQQELADMIGSSRVMVVQALKELKAAGIVDQEKKFYILKEDPCLARQNFE